MRFRFRLESILKLKQHEEEEARSELVSIRREMEREEKKITEIERRISEYERELFERLKEGMEGSRIKLEMAGKMALEIELETARKRLERLKELEKEALENFLEKRKERMALEKLKERRRREFLEEVDRRERRAVDEMAERKHWWGSGV